MTASTQDRVDALNVRVEAADATVTQLRQQIADLESTAHQANVVSNFAAADRALGKLGPLRDELVNAEARLQALQAAQRDVADLARIDAHRYALERHSAALREHRDAASQCLSEVGALMSAVKATLVQAEQHEQAAREAAMEVHSLRVSLGEATPLASVPGRPLDVEIAMEHNPILRTIRNDDRY